MLLGDGIMIDHGVHVARSDEETQPRLAENIDALRIFPVGLRNDRNAVSVRLKHAGDDRMTKGRMIDISIADDVNKIGTVPSARAHFFLCYGQKLSFHSYSAGFNFACTTNRASSYS